MLIWGATTIREVRVHTIRDTKSFLEYKLVYKFYLHLCHLQVRELLLTPDGIIQ